MSGPTSNPFMFYLAAIVSLGGILYGYDMGVISGALLFIQDSIPMSDTQMGCVVGAVLGGALVGTLLAGPFGDHYGRRMLIMSSGLIVSLGVMMVLFAHSFLTLFVARVFLGVGVGIVAVSVPLYVAELVPAKNRGRYISFFQLLLTFGILLAYFVDLIFTPSRNWKAMFAMVLIPAMSLIIGMIFLPESPRWLIAKRKTDKAKKVLNFLHHNQKEAESDFIAIQESLKENEGRWFQLFSKPLLLPSCLAVLIAIFNQLTGINSFLQYAPLILKQAGMGSDMLTMVGSVGIGIINFVSTLIAIFFIDTVGRRPLLLTGVMGVAISLAYLGMISYLTIDSTTAGMLSLIGLFSYILFFAMGPGMVVWISIAELFPTEVRGKGMALCLFFNSLFSTLLSTFFLILVNHLGMGQSYFIFSSFTLAYFALTYCLLPETKAKTLEEIQGEFQRGKLAMAEKRDNMNCHGET